MPEVFSPMRGLYYCKTHYYRAPLNFTHFALVMITHILLALIYFQDSITMPNLAVIQLMRVIKWPRSDYDGSYVKINVRGNKGFYSKLYVLTNTS